MHGGLNFNVSSINPSQLKTRLAGLEVLVMLKILTISRARTYIYSWP